MQNDQAVHIKQISFNSSGMTTFCHNNFPNMRGVPESGMLVLPRYQISLSGLAPIWVSIHKLWVLDIHD